MRLPGSAPRSLPRLVALAASGALLATLAMTVPGAGRGPRPPTVLPPAPPPRTGGDISSFQGMGTWIDIYDSSWRRPRAAVADMAARGVRTLYLETSNFNRPSPFVYKEQTARFVDAAHDHGMRIVAWYLPGFVDIELDYRRSIAAVRFRTDRGEGFDAFGLDIESPEVRDPGVRSERLVKLSTRLRDVVGDYPLGAIIASPRAMERNPTYWPRFPYANLAALYDAFLPMTYYSWRVSGLEGARWYTTKNILIIRREVGSDQVPIHVIGGIASGSTNSETRGFVRAVREHGIVGASFYTFPVIADSEWPILRQIPTNPVQTPALPAPLISPEMGNIPGSDTTHPHEVSYATGGKAGRWDLAFEAFDVQAREVRVFVNWEFVGTLAAGPGDGWTGGRSMSIPASALRNDDTNVIVFAAKGESPDWGVRSVSLASSVAPSPASTTSTSPPTPAPSP
jgi:hypothetical protein